jgi:hypothetical protein
MPFGGMLTVALIGAGSSLGGKFLGGSANVGPTSPSFRRSEQLGDLSKEAGFDTLLPESEKYLQGAGDYYSKILSGDRAAMTEAMAPEIGQITGQLNQEKQNISKFTPQGGGQTGLLSELPFQQEGQVTQLLQQARPMAAQGLEQVAGLAGQEALGFGNLAQNAFTTDINALLGKASQDMPMQQQLGAGVGGLLGGVLGGGVGTGFPKNIIPGGIPGGVPTDIPGGGYLYNTTPVAPPPIDFAP